MKSKRPFAEGASGATRDRRPMDYQRRFVEAIERLKREERYRVFANLERDAARFPLALWRPPGEEHAPREVTVWCSNDYLGMGGHPDVIEAGVKAARAPRRRRRRHPQHFRHASSDRRARSASSPTCTARRRRWSSPRAGSPISPASRPSPRCCPNCLILSDALNHNSMIEGVRRSGCEKQVLRHNDVAHLEELLAAAAARARQADRVREPLFDGRRHRADRRDRRARRKHTTR